DRRRGRGREEDDHLCDLLGGCPVGRIGLGGGGAVRGRIDRTRKYHVGADAVARVLLRDRLGEGDDSRFRDRVGAVAGTAAEGGAGGDEDQRTPTLLHHPR